YLSICFFISIYTAITTVSALSLHDALPISRAIGVLVLAPVRARDATAAHRGVIHLGRRAGDALDHARDAADLGDRVEAALVGIGDRKSTRLNSSHVKISYAVFILKIKK